MVSKRGRRSRVHAHPRASWRCDRLSPAHAGLERVRATSRYARARRPRRSRLRPARDRERRDGSRAAVPGLDAAGRVHAGRRADRAEGAGRVDRPARRLRRRRTAAAAGRLSVCQGRRRDRRGARRHAVRRQAGAMRSGLLARGRARLRRGSGTRCAMRAGLAIHSGVRAIGVEGEGRVHGLWWRDATGAEHRVACDAVGASFGLRSETQLADLAGCAFAFDAVTRQWLPQRDATGRSSVPDVYLAGDGAGIGGADVAELQGERAALAVLEDLGTAIDRSARRGARSQARASGALSPRARRCLSVSCASARWHRRRRDRLPLRRHHRRRAARCGDASAAPMR